MGPIEKSADSNRARESLRGYSESINEIDRNQVRSFLSSLHGSNRGKGLNDQQMRGEESMQLPLRTFNPSLQNGIKAWVTSIRKEKLHGELHGDKSVSLRGFTLDCKRDIPLTTNSAGNFPLINPRTNG
eukprot:c28729_g1_i2 orf=524-910(-)